MTASAPRILFIHGRYSNSWEALGLGYIAAYIRKHLPLATLTFHQGCFDSDATILASAASADIIAFSCTTPTYPHTVALAAQIKAINPNAWIVTGGYHPSAAGRAALAPNINAIVVGEGEEAMLRIAQGDRSAVVQGRMMQFNELPHPDRALIRNERNIAVAFADNGKNITSFQSHRACPFRCVYCLDGANKVLYGNQSWNAKTLVRYRDPDDLLDEIERVTADYNLDLIKFSDPTWNTSIQWVEQFCHRKIERGIKVEFYPNLHAGMMTQRTADLMREAGCYEVAIGVESGSPKVLKQIGKGTTVDSIKRCVGFVKNADILARGYFIVGMPDETTADLQMTESLADELGLFEYGFTLLCPYPGTTMYDAEKHRDVDWALADEYSNDFWSNDHMSNAELKAWQARLVGRFNKNITLRQRDSEAA